jgi:hypothetical protein
MKILLFIWVNCIAFFHIFAAFIMCYVTSHQSLPKIIDLLYYRFSPKAIKVIIQDVYHINLITKVYYVATIIYVFPDVSLSIPHTSI